MRRWKSSGTTCSPADPECTRFWIHAFLWFITRDERLSPTARRLLPIEMDHALEAGNLPQHHRDPFDRMLVVQALLEGIPMVSADPVLDRYGVQRVW